MTELVPQAAGQSETSSSQGHPSPSFEELAMPLFDSAYNLARWLTQNPSEAEDLVQETFLKALRGFSSFQLGTNFRAWIFRIMRNTFLSSRTKLQWRNEVAIVGDDDLTQLPASSGTPESLLIDRCGIDAIRRAIEGLPLVYREVIILCEVEHASYREIAAILSIPIGTVMSRLARARKILQKAAFQSDRQFLSVGWQSTRGCRTYGRSISPTTRNADTFL
jgi:RNA polymerase sigma-70 factor (ECF subfamily)